MIDIFIVLALLFTHFIGDFISQTDWMAKNKSRSNFALLSHTVIYTLHFFVLLMWILPIELNLLFCTVIFILHTLTDYITSRINTKLWDNKQVHWFFCSIGFDQFLHFLQILLTYYIIT